jgi:hypothetical protein
VQTVLHVPQHASLQNDTYMPALPEAPAEDQEVSLENSTPAAKIPERLTAQNVAADVMPRIVRPEVMSNFSDQAQDVDYSDFEAPNKNLPQKSEMSNVNVEIENVPDDRFPFHYQFYERKLFLHGDFKGIPYKIIALNRDKDKTFFLEYEGNYYSLRPDQQEIVPLERIQDSTVIRALNKLNR